MDPETEVQFQPKVEGTNNYESEGGIFTIDSISFIGEPNTNQSTKN
jgi:hypothetical protein